ncbi:hypothetical protein SY86_20595 [Erwinia tracheiphila]|uniref:Uncharacterized protein n=1 Tax=Erwinia tracheiphila TaxID=65700 RepID=A0A0M2KD27_9GAMM|nr:terminase [Erwinia tracheiphila PSU-1]KKF37265.1 hypothetical protein SY86_20595 [Erwinia tracheiphila]
MPAGTITVSLTWPEWSVGLSSTGDITSVCYAFPSDREIRLLTRHYLPEAQLIAFFIGQHFKAGNISVKGFCPGAEFIKLFAFVSVQIAFFLSGFIHDGAHPGFEGGFRLVEFRQFFMSRFLVTLNIET